MTTYAYRCSDCGADFDRRFLIGAAPDTIDCPATNCDGIARRIITTPTVHFLGQGFSRSSTGARTKEGAR